MRLKTASSLSIVVPAYNESKSLPILLEQTLAVLQDIDCPSWEIILVDDGSTDGTREIMTRLAREQRGVKAVLFRRNFGKSAAMMAGFHETVGDIVITMDADLQDDPDEIPQFIQMIESGYDLVSGWKRKRNDPLEKRLPSLFFNWVVRKVSRVELHDNNCGFKAYRRWCINELSLHGNQHRFVAAILAWDGARIGEIPVRHHERRFGETKYGIARYFHGAADFATLILLTRFSQHPLYLFGMIGVPLIVLGAMLGGYLLVNHLLFLIDPTMGFPLTIRPLLIVTVFLFLMGLLIFLIGLLAELVLRSNTLERGYRVREVIEAPESVVSDIRSGSTSKGKRSVTT
jgi:glycosyltransferase involved in cell wall biosynthesis